LVDSLKHRDRRGCIADADGFHRGRDAKREALGGRTSATNPAL
jgi:hypothetical protein